MVEKIYMDDNTVTITVGDTPYSYGVGYMPESNQYVAMATKHPKFCFTAPTREEVEKKAKRALEFYNKAGLTDYEDSDHN